MKNILFICSANKDRSATAEIVCREKFENHSVDSAGTNEKICWQLGTTFITQDLVDWADFIFVMEQKHEQFIQSNFNIIHTTRVRTLNIKDVYTFMEPKLIQRFQDSIFPLIEKIEVVI